MKKTNQNERTPLEAAQAAYIQAAGAYQDLAHTPTRWMAQDAKAVHQAACRTALDDKRRAAAAVQDLLKQK